MPDDCTKERGKRMKRVCEFDKSITISLDEPQRMDAMRALNLHHLGDENCNKRNSQGKLVDKYPDHPNLPKLRESHYSVAKGYIKKIKIAVMEDGRLEIV